MRETGRARCVAQWAIPKRRHAYEPAPVVAAGGDGGRGGWMGPCALLVAPATADDVAVCPPRPPGFLRSPLPSLWPQLQLASLLKPVVVVCTRPYPSKPRLQRLQHPASVDGTMQHACWCRAHGTTAQPSSTPSLLIWGPGRTTSTRWQSPCTSGAAWSNASHTTGAGEGRL